MKRLDDLWNDRGNDIERLVFFSDAVFAVALTLLVLDLSLPDGVAAGRLPAALGALWPGMLALLISFFVISFFWRAHHRVFHLIERYDRWLIGLNFLFLLGIVLQPFSTELISRYGTERLAVTLYAGLLAVTGLLLTVIWVYATAKGLLGDATLDAELTRFYTLRTLIPSLLFLVSAGLALIWPPLWIPWLWLLILPVRGLLKWGLRRRG